MVLSLHRVPRCLPAQHPTHPPPPPELRNPIITVPLPITLPSVAGSPSRIPPPLRPSFNKKTHSSPHFTPTPNHLRPPAGEAPHRTCPHSRHTPWPLSPTPSASSPPAAPPPDAGGQTVRQAGNDPGQRAQIVGVRRARSVIRTALAGFASMIACSASMITCIASRIAFLVTGHASIDTGHAFLVTGHASIDTGRAFLVTGHARIDTGRAFLVTGHAFLVTGHASIDTGRAIIVAGGTVVAAVGAAIAARAASNARGRRYKLASQQRRCRRWAGCTGVAAGIGTQRGCRGTCW